MKHYCFICEAWDSNNSKKIVREWVGVDDIALIGSKIANEQYRIDKILEKYPNAESLSADLKKSGNPKAMQLASKLDAVGNDPQAYYKIVRKLSGRTFCHWLGNLIGGPFALIYQLIQAANNFGGKPDGKAVVYDRI